MNNPGILFKIIVCMIAAGASLLPRIAGAQPTRALGASQKAHPFQLSEVSDVRELSDGRLIVVDRRERAIQLLDFTRGTAQRVGREGAGPLEIAQPTLMLALPADTTAVWDGLNARLFYIGPDGTPLRTARFVADDGSALQIEVRAPRYADAAGMIYFAGVVTAADAPRDSIPLLRFDRRTARADTVGTYLAPKSEPATIGPPGRKSTLSLTNPFAPRQDWIVSRDGRVGIVRAPDYRLDWTAPRAKRGTDISYVPVVLTDADKENWRRNQQSMVMTRDVNSRGGVPSISMVPEPTTWPSHKPPFVAGSGAVLVDYTGRVWVLRAAALNESTVLYDVFDTDSQVTMRVRLPKEQRVVGFGRNVVYTTTEDQDGMVRVSRHAMP